MTKADLIAVLEKQANITHRQAEMIVNIAFDSMIRALYTDDRIEIRGFGSFANRNYKEQIIRDTEVFSEGKKYFKMSVLCHLYLLL